VTSQRVVKQFFTQMCSMSEESPTAKALSAILCNAIVGGGKPNYYVIAIDGQLFDLHPGVGVEWTWRYREDPKLVSPQLRRAMERWVEGYPKWLSLDCAAI